MSTKSKKQVPDHPVVKNTTARKTQKLSNNFSKNPLFKLGAKLLKKIAHITKISYSSLVEFANFCFVGVINTLTNFLAYNIFLKILDTILAPLDLNFKVILSTAVAFIISVLVSFILNYNFTFKTQNLDPKKALLKSYASYTFTGLGLNNLFNLLWLNVLNFPTWLFPLLNSILNIPINFLLNKFWAFKKSH